MTTPQQLHIPVLLDDTIRLLAPKVGDSYLDLTAGYGGHASKVIAQTKAANNATLCDRDNFAIEHLEYLKEQGAELVHSDFLAACRHLNEAGRKFDMILLDLGVSSPQLDNSERGFSFSHHVGPLDMRMDDEQKLTASIIVNTYPEKLLIHIFEEYGEVSSRESTAVARAIVIRRKRQKFTDTFDLAELIRRTVGELDCGKYHKVHPATREFQALRIAVNDELGQLEKTLPLAIKLLNKDGRLAVISFHSLEDRIVKNSFRDQADGLDATVNILTKKPILGSINDVNNPRARSAKLRAVVKIK